VKDGIGREMAGQFGLRFQVPRKSQGSFTCRKCATWDRRIYFPSEGRHAVDFFPRKIRLPRPGSNTQSRVPEASMLTTRPPKMLTHLILYISTVSRILFPSRGVNAAVGQSRLFSITFAVCISTYQGRTPITCKKTKYVQHLW
jgi:hypothetical protein